MTRIIKRYGNRKLYDTSESRYVLLEDISAWIRAGEDIQVVDNGTAEDVTAQTLTQVISEESRKKSQFLSSDLLHDLIRAGESAVTKRVKQISSGVDRFMKRSIDRLVPVGRVRDEMTHLKERLEELEKALAAAESRNSQAVTPAKTRRGTGRAAAAEKGSKDPAKPRGRAASKSKPSAAKKVNKPKAAKASSTSTAKKRVAAKKTAV